MQQIIILVIVMGMSIACTATDEMKEAKELGYKLGALTCEAKELIKKQQKAVSGENFSDEAATLDRKIAKLEKKIERLTKEEQEIAKRRVMIEVQKCL